MDVQVPPPKAKPVHTIVLDAGPLITNTPSISTLLASSERLITLPGVLAEIRDETARARVETTVKPFLQLREPKPSSVKFIVDFARRTGDLAVLSKVDLGVLALTYELECEINGGDWRLRRAPGQKELNGPAPKKQGSPQDDSTEQSHDIVLPRSSGVATDLEPADGGSEERVQVHDAAVPELEPEDPTQPSMQESGAMPSDPSVADAELAEKAAALQCSPEVNETSLIAAEPLPPHDQPSSTIHELETPDLSSDESTASASDSEGWITPSNLAKHQHNAVNQKGSKKASQSPPVTLQSALITTDNALQNVALQINLNVLSASSSLPRIRHLRTYILRCHACFQTTKEMSRQFCKSCGKPTLMRVSCSTDASTGECKLHLKRNMQWNTRGNRYSIPKPVAGTSNGKLGSNAKGGGKGGWGQSLILAEDQKEYVRAMASAGREKGRKDRDLMSEDALPGLLTGVRAGGGGRISIGAGRNVNARKRR